MIGRKWDCLSNSSRARAKDEGRDLNLERSVCLVLIKVPPPLLLIEEIVSKINSSKLIVPLSFRLVTKHHGGSYRENWWKYLFGHVEFDGFTFLLQSLMVCKLQSF